MRGKVINVRMVTTYREVTTDHWRSDVHPVRERFVLADLYDDPKNDIEDTYVDITEDVRDFFGGGYITSNRVSEIRDRLHNVWIDFYHDDEDDEDYLDGDLSDYI